MGKVGFGELAFWLLAARRPTPGEARVFESVLVALADHGFTPTAIAARVTYLSAPDSLQGALAAGPARRRLPVPRRHRGRGVFLHAALSAVDGPLPADDAGWDALALRLVQRGPRGRALRPRASATRCTRSRTRVRPRLLAIAEEEGLRGPHLRLYEAIGRVHPQVLGRTLPLNGAGVCGAALADLDLPVELLRGVALLARAAGLLGQLAEERRRPLAMDMYLEIDRNAVEVARSRPEGELRWLSWPP